MPRKAESLRVVAPTIPSWNTDEVNRLIDEAFESQGWLTREPSGETSQDIEKMRHAMFVAFTGNHSVTTVAAGRSRRAFKDLVQEYTVTKYGLYVELFPHGPGSKRLPTSDEEQVAKDKIADYLWRQCTPSNRSAWLQKELAASGLVVLETTKFADDPSKQNEMGRYVTDVESAMLEFLENKVFEDVRRKVAEADAWLATFMKRNHAISLNASKRAKAALKSAVDSAVHANPAYVREMIVPELEAGPAAMEDDGEVPIGEETVEAEVVPES